MTTPPMLEVCWLGRSAYRQVHDDMKARVAARISGEVPDALWLVEHADVITVGRRRDAERHLLSPGSIPVVRVERGGDVTYHGPGQIVGYPVMALGPGERDLGRFLRAIEQTLIATSALLGVQGARRVEGLTGVWTRDGRRKLASIGIAVRRWVTYHGFALNVCTDLTRFASIEPCGIDASVMTSIAAEGGEGDMEAARAAIGPAAARELGRRLA